MIDSHVDEKERLKRECARLAVGLAMRGRWEDAIAANLSIISEFPRDQEAYNRLGKALSELGRTREAIDAFQHALELSPRNTIARKNLKRLVRLGDAPGLTAVGVSPQHAFIEERGKTCLTPLVKLASGEVLLKLSPGRPLLLEPNGVGVTVTDLSGEYVGKVEPRLACRLVRLHRVGNRYGASVTSVGEQELTVMIREVYRHPSQAESVSFPSRGGVYGVYLPPGLPGYEVSEDERQQSVAVKDWSNDDTEPGDDDAFSPVVHRIISADEETVVEGDGF